MKWFWNLYAQIYDVLRHLLPYRELMARAVSSLELTGDERILDAGCGTGNFALALSDRGTEHFTLDGLDASSAMLARARKKSYGKANVRYQVHDLNAALPFPDGTFDRVVCLNALYATADPSAVVKELRRVLKFGGMLVLANPVCGARVRDGFARHFRMILALGGAATLRELLKVAFLLPVFIVITLLNISIKKKADNGALSFMSEEQLETLCRNNELRVHLKCRLYGETDAFIAATAVRSCLDAAGTLMTLEKVREPEDFARIYRLRYDAYCTELGSLDPAAYPDGQERDQYDARSIHFLLRREEEVVGTFRLILPGEPGFLMEEAFTLPEWVRRERTLEASRIVIRSDIRGARLLNALCEAGRAYSCEHGFDTWCLAPQTGLLPVLEAAGWNIEKFGSATPYHNAVVVPIIRFL